MGLAWKGQFTEAGSEFSEKEKAAAGDMEATLPE